MARHTFGETITVTRKGAPTGERDSQGTPTVGPDTVFTVDDVAIEPTGTTESPQAMGVWTVTGYNLFLPYGTELVPTDRITIRGSAGWNVVGNGEDSGWRNPFDGRGRGNVVGVKRAS
jgi:hypothetical protein